MPATKPDSSTKPSAAETKPNGWPNGFEKRVGMCVIVISTSIAPRSASTSQRRRDVDTGGDTAGAEKGAALGPNVITKAGTAAMRRVCKAYRRRLGRRVRQLPASGEQGDYSAPRAGAD